MIETGDNSGASIINKIADVPHIVTTGRSNFEAALPEIRALAASDRWQEREVAATALVEISKKRPQAVVVTLLEWARDTDPNIRRASIEGLRGLARTSPEEVTGVLELLRADRSAYVRKSVANILRDAGKRRPAFVMDLCRRWARDRNHHTEWIIRQGLRKLRESEPELTDAILVLLGPA